MSKIVLVTGGFDPIHTGHISYFKNAKELYPHTPLCVGLNSDEWLIRKKGKYFLPMAERRAIVEELKPFIKEQIQLSFPSSTGDVIRSKEPQVDYRKKINGTN